MSLTTDPGPAAPPSLVELVGNLLHHRAEIAEALAAAVGDGAVAMAHQRAVQLEQVAATLLEVNRPLAAQLARLGDEAQRLIKALMARSRAADQRLAAALAAQGASSLGEWLRRSGNDPAVLVRELLAEPWQKDRDLVFLAGAGAVAAAQALLDAGQKRIFAFDPTAPVALPSPAGRPPVVNAHALEDLQAACWSLPFPSPEQLRVRQVGGGLPRPVAELAAPLGRMLSAFTQATADGDRLAHVFIRAGLRSLGAIARSPSIEPLEGAFAGVPAVVVAAGPSLDKNLALLPQLAGRAVIIAINQTVRALRRVGVKPDLVMALDPQGISYHFEGTQPGEIGALCLGASVDTQLHQVAADGIFTCASSPACERWMYDLLGEEASLKTAGTVASGAVQLAAFLGCSPIISIGRDLALEGRKYYAEGAADGGAGQLSLVGDDQRKLSMAGLTSKTRMARNEEEAQAWQRRVQTELLELVEVPGFFGAPVTTTTRFVHEIELLRAMLLGLRGKARFINATEGGAYLEGMEHMPLAEVIARHGGGPTIDARAVIRERAATVDLPARKARFAEALASTERHLRELAAAAARCRARCRTARSDADSRYREARRTLQARLADLPVISTYIQRAINDVQRRGLDGFASLNAATAAEEGLYQALENAALDMAKGIATALPEL